MSRHYSTKEFFRQMPNALLARYFEQREVLVGFDFNGMKEAEPDALVEAWLLLPDDQRRIMDAEFQDIFVLASEAGFLAIIDEANWQFRDQPGARTALVGHLAELPSHFDRAMVTFLDNPAVWRGAVYFHHADSLSYWRKRTDLPKTAGAVDAESLEKLAHEISSHFYSTEGRGKHCVVEPFRRGKRDYFFAYPEDYSQQAVEWESGHFARRPHNPAFEVIFVYKEEDGSLDLYCRGATKALEPLQQIFAAAILKMPNLPPAQRDDRVYDLNPLRDRDFEFVLDPSSGIVDVRLKKLRISSALKKGDRLTLEADTTTNRFAIHDLLAKIAPTLPLRAYNVTMVELTARVVVDPAKRPKAVTFSVSHPNSCTLKYDDVGLKLRRMLGDSGIEPSKPGEATRAEAAEA